MKEIPVGKYCGECPLLVEAFDAWEQTWTFCAIRETSQEKDELKVDAIGEIRSPACLAAYPYGGTITPKEETNGQKDT